MGNVHYIYRDGRKIEVKTLYTGPAPTKKRHEQFALVPVSLMLKLAALKPYTRWLAVVLLLKAFRQRSKTFTCADLREFGVTRWQKDKGLIELERAGLIVVERQAPGTSGQNAGRLGCWDTTTEVAAVQQPRLLWYSTPSPLLSFILFFSTPVSRSPPLCIAALCWPSLR